METHLYSKRKCLLFSCTICQRTFVCLFYYCLYNSFLFIEHSSMSVNFFFLSERAKSFLYVTKRTVFQVLGNREIQTNVDKQLLDKNMNTHIIHTFLHICFFPQSEHNVLYVEFKRIRSLTVHVTCLGLLLSISDVGQ